MCHCGPPREGWPACPSPPSTRVAGDRAGAQAHEKLLGLPGVRGGDCVRERGLAVFQPKPGKKSQQKCGKYRYGRRTQDNGKGGENAMLSLQSCPPCRVGARHEGRPRRGGARGSMWPLQLQVPSQVHLAWPGLGSSSNLGR